mmetsp:Transcript_20779/g.57938  ORF Transcript_20779/g.57938 Transcript_20779/m.57938 type:complete len:83 (-) Transcript_20779:1298-1546(-)
MVSNKAPMHQSTDTWLSHHHAIALTSSSDWYSSIPTRTTSLGVSLQSPKAVQDTQRCKVRIASNHHTTALTSSGAQQFLSFT